MSAPSLPLYVGMGDLAKALGWTVKKTRGFFKREELAFQFDKDPYWYVDTDALRNEYPKVYEKLFDAWLSIQDDG